VVFSNTQEMPGGHTIVADDRSFSSPVLGKDKSWSHTFDKAGLRDPHEGAPPTLRVRSS